MKKLIGKIKLKSPNLPRKTTANEVDIFDNRKIVNWFNSFFTNIEVNWQAKFKMLHQPLNST